MPSGTYVRTEEINQKTSKAVSASWVKLDVYEKHSNAMKTVLAKPEIRVKMRKPKSEQGRRNMKEAQNRPEVKEKLRQIARKRMECGCYHVTDIERIMFEALTKESYNIKRNVHIENVGNVDFLLPDYNLIIECDGEVWHSKSEAVTEDNRRDVESTKLGYKTLRFKGNDIKHDLQECLKKCKQLTEKVT